MSNKPKIAFICVHNSCRSQIAEALGKHLAADVFESCSAGTEAKQRINQDAVLLMKELYDIDMGKTQHPKLLDEIPPVHIVITMGCNVEYPYLPCKHREDWGLDDPTGKEKMGGIFMSYMRFNFRSDALGRYVDVSIVYPTDNFTYYDASEGIRHHLAPGQKPKPPYRYGMHYSFF
jgi:arsenate reductase